MSLNSTTPWMKKQGFSISGCVFLFSEWSKNDAQAVAKQIKQFTSQSDILFSKEGRKDGIQKIRDELKKAVKKERYLSKEDAKLINQFLRKIKLELKDSEN